MAPTNTIGRAGEHYVAAELNKRGAYASPFSGNVPGIDIVATNQKHEHEVFIQVKTKQFARARWPLSLRHAWVIPTKPVPECLCLDICNAGRCKEATGKDPTHPHHGDAQNLLTLQEVEGKPNHFWVFVSLEEMQYWILPDEIVRGEMIRQPHTKYLRERGGHRPGSKHGSLDTGIFAGSLTSWLGRWSVLGLGLEDYIPDANRVAQTVRT